MNKNNTFSLKRLIVVLIIIVIAVGIYWVRHARTKDSPAPIRTDTANITASQSRTQDEPRPASPTSHSVTLSKKAQQLKDAQWAQQIANDPAVLAEERDNQRIAETRTVSEALAAYHANGDYPKNLIELTTSSGSTFTVPIAPTPADG